MLPPLNDLVWVSPFNAPSAVRHTLFYWRILCTESLSLGEVQFLAGTLPTEMGLMTSMKVLEIMVAPNLVGSLPTELGLMTNLSSMTLSFINREGTLPVEYSNLTKLETLDFRVNHGLTGTLPTEYGKLLKLCTYTRQFIADDVSSLCG